MKVIRTLLAILLCFPFLSGFSNTDLTTFFNEWKDVSKPDSMRVKAFEDYIWEGFMYSDPDSASALAEEMLMFCRTRNNKIGEALAYNTLGSSYVIRGNFAKALNYFDQSLAIMEDLNDVRGQIASMGNIGVIYKNQGHYVKALEYYNRSLHLAEEINENVSYAAILNNIGRIYQIQNNLELAKQYYGRTLELDIKTGNRSGMAGSLTNLGSIQAELLNYSTALELYDKALSIYRELNDKAGEGRVLNRMGLLYLNTEDLVKAGEYTDQALEIFTNLSDRSGIAVTRINKAQSDLKLENFKGAIANCEIAFQLSEQTNALEIKRDACKCLYEAFKGEGINDRALQYLEILQIVDDSLQDDETAKKLQQIEFKKHVLADSLKLEEEKLRVQLRHEAEVRKKNVIRNFIIGIGSVILIIAFALWQRLQYVRHSKTQLAREKARSDDLLLNILPAEIAEELKEKGKADARDFDAVSILFTDFKEFTQKSEQLSAIELVEEINICFEAFDGICEKYSIEKIKTIGDSYMAAGGLPVPSDESVKNTVLAGLEMSQFIMHRKEEKIAKGEVPFEMRVGIHTGPVVAGIAGIKKFQYDIWGDTVNTASRMESNSEVGKVNISQHTYEIISEDPLFAFEARGKINVKGKGEVEMYFVSLSVTS